MKLPENLQNTRNCIGEYVTDFTFALHGIIRLHHLHMTRSAQEIGLSAGQPPVLMFLSMKNQQTQRELCDSLFIKPASMTDLLQRMERDELVERIRDEKDQRSLRVEITKKGEKKLEDFIEKGRVLDEICFKGFQKEEKDVCVSYFLRILKNMDAFLNETEDHE